MLILSIPYAKAPPTRSTHQHQTLNPITIYPTHLPAKTINKTHIQRRVEHLRKIPATVFSVTFFQQEFWLNVNNNKNFCSGLDQPWPVLNRERMGCQPLGCQCLFRCLKWSGVKLSVDMCNGFFPSLCTNWQSPQTGVTSKGLYECSL